MNIWYSVIIHERPNDSPSLRMRSSRHAKFEMAERALLTSMPVFTCLKLRIKNKMRKGNHLYEIEVREVDKEMKRIKIHYKGVSEDTDH